jgi:hypothetical protein
VGSLYHLYFVYSIKTGFLNNLLVTVSMCIIGFAFCIEVLIGTWLGFNCPALAEIFERCLRTKEAQVFVAVNLFINSNFLHQNFQRSHLRRYT